MRLLILADIHSDLEMLSKILDSANIGTDLVVCPGNITDMASKNTDFTQLDSANMILQKIISFGKPVFCVPGNHDPYEIINTFNEYEVNLHNTVRVFGGLKFMGWGGALTPFNTLFEPTEKETKEHLTQLSKKINKNSFVLIVHNPPKNTKLDKIKSGKHVGSVVIRNFIEEHQPLLTISAHIHESPGEDVLGKAKLFYPGPVFEGNYGIVEIKDNFVTCERKQVKI